MVKADGGLHTDSGKGEETWAKYMLAYLVMI